MKQRGLGPGLNQSKFKHSLTTILDRGGGGLLGGPLGGCSRVEPWGNVTDDMAKNHVQKHCETFDRMSHYMTKTDMTKINPLLLT